ncbi:putative beta-lysine N-acetyltransferase [Desulfotalea psychrophila]|uniref:putative beta-lysine N-acetyltransferase n=1 Tax=Desulfotalea psychrophila TaxID=84980 RepID=UPI0006745CD3|nr:putative beta-lysine N-acetyltransferase [Desulfotalea psychrophila]
MSDKIEMFRDSVIQHGPENDRVYVMKTTRTDCQDVIHYALKLADSNGYSKIFAKFPESCKQFFEQNMFIEEAKVPGLFNGEECGYFSGRYIDLARKLETRPELIEQVIEAAHSKYSDGVESHMLSPGLTCRIMNRNDINTMAFLFKQVFPTYPFPIHDPDYLATTMEQNVIYHGIFKGTELIAQSSAEIDFNARNVEMTDFATHLNSRGKGLATYLLAVMEDDVMKRGVQTAYTIARAYSFGMNSTFAKRGYQYAGTLTNNTQISGQLESMNVWYKQIHGYMEGRA